MTDYDSKKLTELVLYILCKTGELTFTMFSRFSILQR